MSNELDIITPPSETVKLADGEIITITPVKMGELRAFAAAAAPIATELAGLSDGAALDLSALLLGNDLLTLVAIGSRVPEDRLNELAVDEFLALSFAVVRVNADFFVRRLLPQVTNQVAAMRVAVEQVAAATGGLKSSKP